MDDRSTPHRRRNSMEAMQELDANSSSMMSNSSPPKPQQQPGVSPGSRWGAKRRSASPVSSTNDFSGDRGASPVLTSPPLAATSPHYVKQPVPRDRHLAPLATDQVQLQSNRNSVEGPAASSTPTALRMPGADRKHSNHLATSHGSQIGSMLSVASSTRSVSYTTRTGKTLTIEEPVVTVNPDGTTTMNQYSAAGGRWKDNAPLLKEKHFKIYKILSIFAAVLFFPTGIPAVYFYLKAKEHYYQAILEASDLDKATRYARFCRNFLILSLVLFIILVILIISLVEKQRLGY